MISPPRCDGGRGSWVKANLTMTLIIIVRSQVLSNLECGLYSVRYIAGNLGFQLCSSLILSYNCTSFFMTFFKFHVIMYVFVTESSHPANSILYNYYFKAFFFFVKIGSSCNFNLKSCEMWSNFVEELTRKIRGCGSVVQAAWDSLFGLRVWVPL